MPDSSLVLIWENSVSQINKEIQIPYLFEESELIIGFRSDRLYFPAATLRQYFDFPGVGNTLVDTHSCISGNQLIRFVNVQPYRLRITLNVNVRFTVSIWRSPMPITNPVRVTIPSDKTTVIQNFTVAVTTVAATVLVGNQFRKGFSILNKSTSTLLLDFGQNSVSLTTYAVRVEPGGFYEDAYSYTGDVTGIWTAADATGAAEIRAFVE